MNRARSPEFADQPIPGGEGISSGATLAAGYPETRFIHCNVGGSYRLWNGSSSQDRVLNEGTVYEYATDKVTAGGGSSAVSDNDVIVT